MNCPGCQRTKFTKVIDSRSNAGTVRRRRACANCGARWTTYEVKVEDLQALQIAQPAIALRAELRVALERVNAILSDENNFPALPMRLNARDSGLNGAAAIEVESTT